VARDIESTFIFSLAAVVIASFGATASLAQPAFVIGGGYARDCYLAVKDGAPIRASRTLCDMALEREALSQEDLSATYVNRGILSIRERRGEAALADMNAALRQNPSLAAAFLNRAGAYLLLGRWQDARVDADTALGIGLTQDAWAAHFNRGVALERLGQVSDAYGAFQQAAALAPSRPEVQTELARFSVVREPRPTPNR
jgi:tetratricopeptide (TPR) repeat protein